MTQLEKQVTHVPGCVIEELLKKQVETAHAARVQLDMEFETKLRAWDGTKVSGTFPQ